MDRSSSPTREQFPAEKVVPVDDSTEPFSPREKKRLTNLKDGEVLPWGRYQRCQHPWYVWWSTGVSLVCAAFNAGFIVAGESGLIPRADYDLFGWGYPLLWGAMVLCILHRVFTIKRYGKTQVGARTSPLERLTALKLPEDRHATNRRAASFFHWVLSAVFGGAALFQGPVYAYLVSQRLAPLAFANVDRELQEVIDVFFLFAV